MGNIFLEGPKHCLDRRMALPYGPGKTSSLGKREIAARGRFKMLETDPLTGTVLLPKTRQRDQGPFPVLNSVRRMEARTWIHY